MDSEIDKLIVKFRLEKDGCVDYMCNKKLFELSSINLIKDDVDLNIMPSRLPGIIFKKTYFHSPLSLKRYHRRFLDPDLCANVKTNLQTRFS